MNVPGVFITPKLHLQVFTDFSLEDIYIDIYIVLIHVAKNLFKAAYRTFNAGFSNLALKV